MLSARLSDPSRAGIAYRITPPSRLSLSTTFSSPRRAVGPPCQHGSSHGACVPFLLLLFHPEHCAITSCQLPVFLKGSLTSPHPKGISYYKPASGTVYIGVKTKEAMNMCGLINTSWHYKLTKILNAAPTFLGSLKCWHKLPFTFSNDGYSKYIAYKSTIKSAIFSIFIGWGNGISFARMYVYV